jgi:tetratricopeptide (TPR) repeat protein
MSALQIARDLFDRGHFIEARRALEGDESAEALLLAGQCHQRVGEVQQALRLYKQAADISPDLAGLRVALAAFRSDDLTVEEKTAVLPYFSLPLDTNIDARRFLDLVAAPNLSTIYANDNVIVFQRALTFLRDSAFMEAAGRWAEPSVSGFDDRTWRIHILIWAARNALKLKGDFVELGTYTGRFAKCITDVLGFGNLDRRLYLYDTFAGLPDDADLEDHLPATFYAELNKQYSHAGIYESVRDHFATMTNVSVVRGKLPDTLQDTCPESIAWLHIDLNSSVHEIQCLEFLWDRIVPSGQIILDDFGHCIFTKQTEAHQAFFASKGLTIAELPTGQGLVIKL